MILAIKSCIYDFISNILHSFDESSLGQNIDILYQLTFFCLLDNEYLCERFWSECKGEERDNITVLFANLVEIFPINIEKTLTFFSLILRTNKTLCKEVSEF